jgi:hypothetical protein
MDAHDALRARQEGSGWCKGLLHVTAGDGRGPLSIRCFRATSPFWGLAAKGRCSLAMTQRLLRSSVLAALRGSRSPADLAGGSFHMHRSRGAEHHINETR